MPRSTQYDRLRDFKAAVVRQLRVIARMSRTWRW